MYVPPSFPRHIRGTVLRIPHLVATGLTPTGLSPSTAPLSRGLRVHPGGIGRGPATPHPPYLSAGVRFALCRFPSPVLTASLLVSFPAGTKMFQFPAFPLLTERVPLSGTQEVPFGDPRIYGSMRLPGAYRSLARPSSAPEPSHPPAGFSAASTHSAGTRMPDSSTVITISVPSP